MKSKKWILWACPAVLVLTLVGGIFIGRLMPGATSEEEISDWLSEAPAGADGSRLKEKNLELLGQVVLLKKMLGEIEGEVVLMGPVGSYPIARGRLVWDSARMEGFLHAVQLKPGEGIWFVDGYHQGKRKIHCRVDSPDGEGTIQSAFKPQGRLLGWDEFRVVVQNKKNEQEVVLVGKRSQF